MKTLYMKISKYNGYDDWYLPLVSQDGTWKEILDKIESALDDKYLDNESLVLGINFSMEIVDRQPEDLEDSFI